MLRATQMLGVIVVLLCVSCAWGAMCSIDDDCVPATCCHATKCVHHSAADSCESILCPATCVAHSLDCGGECRCSAGNCTAVIRAGRPPPGVEFRAPTPAPRLVGTGVAYVRVKRLVPVQRSRPTKKQN